ncbi:M23 family metallopeptidase [Alphaproteobacteria bacterium]|nr:M23 family metallopeptidase [Alphaproteobacteria bacterium]
MTDRGKKAVTSGVVRVLRAFGLAGLYAHFAPKVRHSNQNDMPTVTINRIWFLRENRFLIFTRGGPIEVSLKPSLVLSAILICMFGVVAIFYSAIIASYSAIGVMREETIKTAEASINPKNGATISKYSGAGGDFKWLDYHPTTLDDLHPPVIAGKTAQSPRLIIGPARPQPAVSAPQTPQISQTLSNVKMTTDDDMPMIIQGGKRVTLASEATLSKPQLISVAESKPTSMQVNQLSSTEVLPIDAPENANVTTFEEMGRKPMNSEHSKSEQVIAEQIMAENSFSQKSFVNLANTKEIIIKQNPATAASSPTIGSNSKTTGIATDAQEFTIALLPNFASAPKDKKILQAQPDKNDGNLIDNARLALPPLITPKAAAPDQFAANTVIPRAPKAPESDGLQTGFYTQRQGPILPLVTDAARTKKMLLALEQEIEYIRSTVIDLGISVEALPREIEVATTAKNDNFKNIMINLAEHRAALRKIPFKPPMLYFYISSDYGNRKHPKTGKTSFHHGVDLAGTWQENVRVTAPGTVIYAGTEGSFGKVVRVKHDFGIVTTYAHLARITVKLGDYIGENHVIGKMGNTGRSAGAHLHYEIRINNKSIDPVKFMTVGREISVAGELRQSSLIE